MTKYKFLILILMIIKSIYYSEAKRFDNIFIKGDRIEAYGQRMIEQGLPFVGQTFKEYISYQNTYHQNKPTEERPSLISEEEYKILMNSIPRINDSMESVNNRNLNAQIELQLYKDETMFKELKYLYPGAYETLEDYSIRTKLPNIDKSPLLKQIFAGLKWYCPNIGETYDEYFNDRLIRYGIRGYSEQEFTKILQSYPKFMENIEEFILRTLKEYKDDIEFLIDTIPNNYAGLRTLFPIFAETYSEYLDRMVLKSLVPMKYESYIIYQAYYPNLCVQYITFSYTMTMFKKTKPRFKSLNLEIYSEKTYDWIKTKFPTPFESQVHYDRRNKDEIDPAIYVRFFAKRMYPKMSETYTEYQDRINNIFFPDQSEMSSEHHNEHMINSFPNQSEISSEHHNEHMINYLKPMSYDLFVEYKKNYPQFQVRYNTIQFKERIEHVRFVPVVTDEQENENNYVKTYEKLIKKNEMYIHQKNLNEVTMDVESFKLLIKRLPGIFENYTFYSHKMFILATNVIDEEEFEDLKKIYIKLCETYENYEIRMNQLEIIPTTTEITDKFKMSVPPIYERREGNYFQLVSSDQYDRDEQKKAFIYGYRSSLYGSPFFFENSEEANDADRPTDLVTSKRVGMYSEYTMGDYHYVKTFDYSRYKVFKLIYPRAFENYESYKKRINKLQNDYDFSDFDELNDYQRNIFRTFLVPFTKEECTDLKLIFPKLSETPNDYEDRLESYVLQQWIDNKTNNLFSTIKHAQIQPFDDFETYEKRYKRTALKKRLYLSYFKIVQLDDNEFNLFKKYLPTKPYEHDYLAYTKDMEENTDYILDEIDYDDIMNVFPKYHDTLSEYNKLMESRRLNPATNLNFIIFKTIYPHLMDYDFNGYELRLRSNHNLNFKLEKYGFSLMNQLQFETFKLHAPRQFESIKAYTQRLPNVSTALYDNGDDKRFKRIYPQVCSTYSEFSTVVKSMGILLTKETFDHYKKSESSFMMTSNELNLFHKKFPKAPERYSNYEHRMLLKGIEPLNKSEFNDLKKLFSLPYETYKEHKNRVVGYQLTPLTLNEFKQQKSYRVLIGETFDEHVNRILGLFFEPKSFDKENSKSKMNKIIEEEGIETLILEYFIEHVLSYPFNYDSYEKFCSRQDNIKSKFEPDPQVKTKIWYDTMKKLLPKINENITTYRERISTYKLEFPEITVYQFYRHLYALPYPAESLATFYSRTQYLNDSHKINMIPLPPSVIDTLIPQTPLDIAMSTPATKQCTNKGKSHRTPFLSSLNLSKDNTSPAVPKCSGSPTAFSMCHKIEFFLNDYKIEAYNIFITLLPNMVTNHQTYSEKVKDFGDPLCLEELVAFKECLPKLLDSFSEFNTRIKSMGFAEIKYEAFNKLKIFYPRIHHILYDNYVLDIELKYAKEESDYRGVIDALTLSSNEFAEYKLKFPKQFEFSYVTYQKRMANKGISEDIIFTKDQFYEIRKANFPLPDEDYKQHKAKLDSLAIDPIPYDVFRFLKGIYPDLFEHRYIHRIRYTVQRELELPNYYDDKYKLNSENKIISEIVNRSKPHKEHQDKVDSLLSHMMTEDEFDTFTINFPKVFVEYSSFVQNWPSSSSSTETPAIMDEEMFKSLKKAYFISVNETYAEYKTKMESLNLTTFTRNIIRYMKSTYPPLIDTYESYQSDLKFYETNELRNYQNYVRVKINSLGYNCLLENNYNIFQSNFPRIFDSSTNFLKVCSRDNMPIMFNHDEFDAIKIAYIPRLAENYENYKTRMIGLGLWVLDEKSFESFKAVYPNFETFTNYSYYKMTFEQIGKRNVAVGTIDVLNDKDDDSKTSIGIRHIMTQMEFDNGLIEDFPKLFESWEDYNKRRQGLNYEINRLINDDGIFSKNLFNDIKIVYYPILGQTIKEYLQFITSLKLPASINWINHFKNLIKLYPIFFESINSYKKRIQGSPLEYLKLDDKLFDNFFKVFPFPYESYLRYKRRNTLKEHIILSEEKFNYFRQVFPLITETYSQYKDRLIYELHFSSVMTQEMFVIFKSWFPQLDETYANYEERFENNLRKIDGVAKQQLLSLVKYMKTSNDADIDTKTSESAEGTSSATNIETYGAMSKNEFNVFKLSLPIPKECYENYKIRINRFASSEEYDRMVLPEVLPLQLFDDIIKSYPNNSEISYSDYCIDIEHTNNKSVSSDTFDKLIGVTRSMLYNPFTFEEILFYKIVVGDANRQFKDDFTF